MTTATIDPPAPAARLTLDDARRAVTEGVATDTTLGTVLRQLLNTVGDADSLDPQDPRTISAFGSAL